MFSVPITHVADSGHRRGVAPAAEIVNTGPQAPVRQAGPPRTCERDLRPPVAKVVPIPGRRVRLRSNDLDRSPALETIATPFMWTVFTVFVVAALAVDL